MELEPGDSAFVVFYRIVDAPDLPADGFAAVIDGFDHGLRSTNGLAHLPSFGNVYGGLVVVRANPAAALRAGQALLRLAARTGVRLAVGLCEGRLARADSPIDPNVVGGAINRAARLAAHEEAVGRVAVDADAAEQAAQAAARFGGKFFGPLRQGQVKDTELAFKLVAHADWHQGKLASPNGRSDVSGAQGHVVLYDVAGFSSLGEDGQQRAVDATRRAAQSAIERIGRRLTRTTFAPNGDGGAVVFAAGEGRAGWTFALALRLHAVSEGVRLRIGVANGAIVRREFAVPVGPAVFAADRACAAAMVDGIDVTRRFWNGVLHDVDRADAGRYVTVDGKPPGTGRQDKMPAGGARITARFLLDERGRPESYKPNGGRRHYRIVLGIADADPGVSSVGYTLDETFEDERRFVVKTPPRFEEEIGAYGDFDVQAELRGQGRKSLARPLAEALRESHGGGAGMNEAIEKALKAISSG